MMSNRCGVSCTSCKRHSPTRLCPERWPTFASTKSIASRTIYLSCWSSAIPVWGLDIGTRWARLLAKRWSRNPSLLSRKWSTVAWANSLPGNWFKFLSVWTGVRQKRNLNWTTRLCHFDNPQHESMKNWKLTMGSPIFSPFVL